MLWSHLLSLCMRHMKGENKKKNQNNSKNFGLRQRVGMCADVQWGSRWKQLISFNMRFCNLDFCMRVSCTR